MSDETETQKPLPGILNFLIAFIYWLFSCGVLVVILAAMLGVLGAFLWTITYAVSMGWSAGSP